MKYSSQQPPLVLVADANEDNLYLLATVVQDLGFRSLAVDSGTSAVRACKRHCPDLALLETRFSDIHGSKILAAIRRCHPKSRIPAIAVTSAAMPGDRAHCLNLGFNDYLAKPYSISSLEQLIYKYVPWKQEHGKSSKRRSQYLTDLAQTS